MHSRGRQSHRGCATAVGCLYGWSSSLSWSWKCPGLLTNHDLLELPDPLRVVFGLFEFRKSVAGIHYPQWPFIPYGHILAVALEGNYHRPGGGISHRDDYVIVGSV